MKTTDEVKKDLRRLRRLTHSIEVSLRSKERHEKRIEYLRAEESNPNVDADWKKECALEREKLQRVVNSLYLEPLIKQATDLEARYMSAINKLEPLDRMIIIDGYLNGTAYWKIGQKIGYTKDGIQKRVKQSIETIAKFV